MMSILLLIWGILGLFIIVPYCLESFGENGIWVGLLVTVVPIILWGIKHYKEMLNQKYKIEIHNEKNTKD